MTEDNRFDVKDAHVLMSDDRKAKLPADQIIEHLDINPNDIIADLGAGNGYFAIPMAKNAKTVYAVDIEPEMLEMLKENADQEQVKNIQYVESNLDQIQLDNDSVEKVMISFVLHHVPDVDKTVREIKRILKPGGQMLVIEFKALETESGPPLHIRIPADEMAEKLKRHGFTAEIIQLNSENYAVKATLNES